MDALGGDIGLLAAGGAAVALLYTAITMAGAKRRKKRDFGDFGNFGDFGKSDNFQDESTGISIGDMASDFFWQGNLRFNFDFRTLTLELFELLKSQYNFDFSVLTLKLLNCQSRIRFKFLFLHHEMTGK